MFSYRVYDAEGHAVADLLTRAEENPDFKSPFRYVDPQKPWKEMYFTGCTFKELQIPIIRNGKSVYEQPDLKSIQEFVKRQLASEIWQEEQRFENPHCHFLDMSPAYYELKKKMLTESRKKDVGNA